MSRYYGLDAANELLPDVVEVVDRLRAQRLELVHLREAYRVRETELLGELVAGAPDDPAGDLLPFDDSDDPELRVLRLRMRGIVDQMQADAAWLDDREIVLRDIASGLLDFPAMVAGRPVWLCWRSGEPEIGWWHLQSDGFAGRRPIADLGSAEPRARG